MSPRLLLACLASLLVLTGCSGLDGAGDKGYITGDGTVRELAVADRGEPRELDGPGLDGEPLSLADHRGKPVVVVVWGSWCPPCRAEAPELAELAEEYGDRVQFLGINSRDSDESRALAFNRNFGITYPSFFSPSGEALLAFRGALTPNSIPSTLVLDAEGRVAASILGQVPSKGVLAELIDTVLAEAARADGAGETSGRG